MVRHQFNKPYIVSGGRGENRRGLYRIYILVYLIFSFIFLVSVFARVRNTEQGCAKVLYDSPQPHICYALRTRVTRFCPISRTVQPLFRFRFAMRKVFIFYFYSLYSPGPGIEYCTIIAQNTIIHNAICTYIVSARTKSCC